MVHGRVLLSLGQRPQSRTFRFRLLLGRDQCQHLVPLGFGQTLCSGDRCFGLGRFRPGDVGRRAGGAFRLGLLGNRDLPFLLLQLQVPFLGNLGCLDFQVTRDLGSADCAVARHLRFANSLLLGDACGLRLAFRVCALPRDFGLLSGLERLDLLVLADPGLLLVALDLKLSARGLHGRQADRHFRVGIDLRALLLGRCYDLGQLAHADRVECVVLVQRGERRLVEGGQRHGLDAEPVLGEVLRNQHADLLHEA